MDQFPSKILLSWQIRPSIAGQEHLRSIAAFLFLWQMFKGHFLINDCHWYKGVGMAKRKQVKVVVLHSCLMAYWIFIYGCYYEWYLLLAILLFQCWSHQSISLLASVRPELYSHVKGYPGKWLTSNLSWNPSKNNNLWFCFLLWKLRKNIHMSNSYYGSEICAWVSFPSRSSTITLQ